MTLTEHLTELRRRLMIMVAAFLVMASSPSCSTTHPPRAPAALLPGQPPALRLLRDCAPRRFPCGSRSARSAPGPRLAIIFWQFWRFITPGLRSRRSATPCPRGGVHCLVPAAAPSRTTSSRTPRVLEAIAAPSCARSTTQPVPGLILLMMRCSDHLRVPRRARVLGAPRVVTPKKLLSWWRWAVIASPSPLRSLRRALTVLDARPRCAPDRLLLRFHRHRKILGR